MAKSYGIKILGEWPCRAVFGLAKASPVRVDVDTDSETDEEVQTVPAIEVKSVPVLARPSDDTEGPGDTPNNENNDSPVVVSEPDDSQQATTARIPRRSSRISRPPRPFWIARTDSATLALVSTNVATDECFISTDVPQSYKEATSSGNACWS